MERLHIEATRSTLFVDFNPEEDVFVMKGESYPENALKFFTPVLEWLAKYLDTCRSDTSMILDMDIIYFNSSSSKALMNLFELLESAAGSGMGIRVNWRHHEMNDVACECGEEFAEDLQGIAFLLHPYGDEGSA
jgi:hypothetical protein